MNTKLKAHCDRAGLRRLRHKEMKSLPDIFFEIIDTQQTYVKLA